MVAHTQNNCMIYFSLSTSSIGKLNILLSSPVYCSQTFDLQHKCWFSEGQLDLLTHLKDDTFMHGAVSVSDVTHLWKVRIVIWKKLTSSWNLFWRLLRKCVSKSSVYFKMCVPLYQLWFKWSFLTFEHVFVDFYLIYYLHVIDATLNFPFVLSYLIDFTGLNFSLCGIQGNYRYILKNVIIIKKVNILSLISEIETHIFYRFITHRVKYFKPLFI